jgi:hypothetical protein
MRGMPTHAAHSRLSTTLTPRLRLALLLVATVIVGVASRRAHLGIAVWDKSVGDVLYAVAAYLTLGIAFPRMPVRVCAAITFVFCFAIELFQITGIPMELGRTHPWTHWFLGSAFGWHDVLCYAIGVVLIAFIASRVVPRA